MNMTYNRWQLFDSVEYFSSFIFFLVLYLFFVCLLFLKILLRFFFLVNIRVETMKYQGRIMIANFSNRSRRFEFE